MPTPEPLAQSFSQVLEALAEAPGDRLTLAEMMEAFGDRALSAVVVLFALISLLPWPPGTKVVFSVPLVVLSLELALQRRTATLPEWLLRWSLSRQKFASVLARVITGVRWIERLSRPRWPVMTAPAMRSVIGLTCALLAIVLALPIPFGDLLPAATIVVLGFGLLQRDGAVILIGLIASLACAIYVALVWEIVTRLFVSAVHWAQALLG